jgi:hexokinase
MYLGEIARNILIYLIDLPAIPGSNPPQYYLFKGHSTKKMNTQYGFDTELLSKIKEDSTPGAIRSLLVEEMGFITYQISDLDAEVRTIGAFWHTHGTVLRLWLGYAIEWLIDPLP